MSIYLRTFPALLGVFAEGSFLLDPPNPLVQVRLTNYMQRMVSMQQASYSRRADSSQASHTWERDAYPEEYTALQDVISKTSTILNLDPSMNDGLIRIGGRLRHASISPGEGSNHSPKTKSCHNTTGESLPHESWTPGATIHWGSYQGCRPGIVAGKRLISSALHRCVTCRKLRGRLEVQKMADLPPEHLISSVPFTYVGLDVFGPWEVRTRGGAAQSKRWAILFTCMSSRAVHVEVIESMDAAICINALRRFFAIRGPASQLRSDRGTNFIGASSEQGMWPDDPKQTSSLKYLHENGCTWEFNPPQASHMGRVWEGMIGMTRRILDSMLLRTKHTHLTPDVLWGGVTPGEGEPEFKSGQLKLKWHK